MNNLREQVKNSKFFYRDRYRLMCNLVGVALFIVIVLNLAMLFVSAQQSLPAFYASSASGELVSLVPLSAPNYSATPLIQ